ncbi:MAG: alpha/beta hydrolase-fold protein [Candidatus Glassbacteria bacterium]
MANSTRDFYDRMHYSKVFDQWRHYRILLPPDYESGGKYYPVIYYFHGHSSRFMAEPYGDGQQVSLPEMIDYVKTHDVIVVRWDGWVEEDYSSAYSGSPYDIQGDPAQGQPGKDYDFGLYFKELVAHVDSAYRTVADRQHRATCGLSMGGFMSLYLSGRYPDLVGSASSYNPGHEFWVGPLGMKRHYLLQNFVRNHTHSKIRLIRASGDYISQYHEELNEVYSRTPEVDYEYRREEYHRHWVIGLAETFDFHRRAFASKELNDYPVSFDHDDAFAEFSVWGCDVSVTDKKPGFICLRDVTRNHLRVFTREYQPDGPPVSGQNIRIVTAPWYGNRRQYRIMDYNHSTGLVSYRTLTSTEKGRLAFEVDGAGHELSVLDGKEGRAPLLIPLDLQDTPIVKPDENVHLKFRLLNSCDVVARNIGFSLSSRYPTVRIDGGEFSIDSLAPGEVADLGGRVTLRFVSTSGFFQHCRLDLHLTYQGWHGQDQYVDVRVLPTPLAAPDSVEILDGRTVTLPVFRQRGNQGGGSIYRKTVSEGTGNGNGIAEPGEEVTVWVRVPQGLDPLDKHTWQRTKVYTDDPRVTVTRDIAEQKELEWTSVNNRTSAVRLADSCQPGSQIELILTNESFSYVWKPDYRFGRELLYQAFQFHRNDVSRYRLRVGR